MKQIYFKISFTALIYTVLLFLVSSCSKDPTSTPPGDERIIKWNEDIDFLSTQFKAREYGFSSIIPEKVFDEKINKIKNSLTRLQDYEIYIEISRLMASLKVSHITFLPAVSQKFHFLPLMAKKFSDGVYIVLVDSRNIELLGKKILKVGNKDISEVEDSLKKIISFENEYWFNYQISSALSFVEALKYFGFTNDLNKVEIDIEGAGKITLNTNEHSYTSFTYGFKSIVENLTELPVYLQNYTSNYWFYFYEQNAILYIAYNRCKNDQNKSFTVLTSEIQNFINTHQVQKVVIDLRNNIGGSADIVKPLVNYLSDSFFNQSGKLFVLTGNQTYSAGVWAAIDFKLNTNCLIVGEPTGGKPNGYAEVLNFTLPNSGDIVYYCTKYFNLLNDDPETLFPDVYQGLNAHEFMNGLDPVMDYVINY